MLSRHESGGCSFLIRSFIFAGWRRSFSKQLSFNAALKTFIISYGKNVLQSSLLFGNLTHFTISVHVSQNFILIHSDFKTKNIAIFSLATKKKGKKKLDCTERFAHFHHIDCNRYNRRNRNPRLQMS